MMKILKLYILLFCIASSGAWAQDPQYSQFYANPLYLNPAFAGSALAPRLTVNYRNQWPSQGSFVQTSFGVDHFMPNLNSGVGLLVTDDSQGNSAIRMTDVTGLYAYQLKINDGLAVRLGLQATYANRRGDFTGLIFGDQLTDRGPTGSQTNDPLLINNSTPSISYLTFGGGLLVYSDKYWFGTTVKHLNQPNLGFYNAGNPNNRLPMNISVHGGFKIPFGGYTGLGDEMDREKSITPAFNYRHQGVFDQLDVGVYATYSPLVLGVWYRGLPLKKYAQNINNHDAAVILVGYRYDNFSFGYSYDATISSLGPASGGSHEISLSYTLSDWGGGRDRSRRKDNKLPCPKF